MNEIKVKSHIKDYTVKFAPIGQLDDKFVIHGANVNALYNLSNDPIILDAIEENKSLAYVEELVKTLLSKGIQRQDTLVAIGGGVIFDIVGFTASVILRGVDWVFYPSTLLAMVDSCLGSKTCINVGGFKNQIGDFYPPSQVIIDTNFLKTLPDDDIKSGMGEAVKFHMVAGKPIDVTAPIEKIIYDTLMIKRDYVERDEFDRGERHLLGFGHTFGHGIESITHYKVKHGQAVALGCGIANYISVCMGLLGTREYNYMEWLFEPYYPDFRLTLCPLDEFLAALVRDKKNKDDNLTAILTKGPGKMFETQIPYDKLRSLLNDYCHDTRALGKQTSQEQESQTLRR